EPGLGTGCDADAQPRKHRVTGLHEPATAEQRGRGVEVEHRREAGGAEHERANVGAVDPRRTNWLFVFVRVFVWVWVFAAVGRGVGAVVDRTEVAIEGIGARRIRLAGIGLAGIGLAGIGLDRVGALVDRTEVVVG